MITSALGSGWSKKLPGGNFTRPESPLASTYSSKIGPTSGRSKPIPWRCGFASATCVIRSPCAVPTSTAVWYLLHGKLAGDGQVGAAAHAGHGLQELLQPRRIGVKGHERVGVAVFGFVLRKPSAQRRGEMAPEGIEPLVGHLQNAADIGRLALVEEEIGGRACCSSGRRGVREISATPAHPKNRAPSADAGRAGPAAFPDPRDAWPVR